MKKNSIKRFICYVMVMILAFSTLAGCGSKTTTTTNTPATNSESTDSSSSGSETVDYGPELHLQMGSTGATDDISTKAAQYFCDLVKERSGGVITIDLFPASQLGAQLDQMEMLSQGSIDLFLEANLMGSFGINTGAMSVLFCTRSRDELAAVQNSDLWNSWSEQFTNETNIKILTNNWFRNGTAIASKNKIETLEDCAGVKLRVPPVASTTAMFNSLGFNATPVAYSETLISLQQNVIDAVWCTEDAIWTMGFYEPANYVLELNAGADAMYVYMNNDLYTSKLTDAQRDLIVQAAKDAGDYYSGLTYETLETNKANWEAHGVETITLSAEEAEKWAEITYAHAYQQEADGVWDAGLFDQVLAVVEAARSGK
nr:TRAP transporter substrate-binding protein [uncultured Oscillibacter sp.]